MSEQSLVALAAALIGAIAAIIGAVIGAKAKTKSVETKREAESFPLDPIKMYERTVARRSYLNRICVHLIIATILASFDVWFFASGGFSWEGTILVAVVIALLGNVRNYLRSFDNVN